MPKIVNHDDRRRELIEACWTVLSDQGVEGLSLRKVATAAKCATGRITHYFENREELLLAAIEASLDDIDLRTNQVLKKNIPALEKMLLIVDEVLPLDTLRLREGRVWMAFWNFASTDPRLAKENDMRHRQWYVSLHPILAEINSTLDVKLEAKIFVGLMNGLVVQTSVHPTPANRKMARATLQAHLKGLSER